MLNDHNRLTTDFPTPETRYPASRERMKSVVNRHSIMKTGIV